MRVTPFFDPLTVLGISVLTGKVHIHLREREVDAFLRKDGVDAVIEGIEDIPIV